MKNKTQPKKNKSGEPVEYEQLGRLLQSVYETGFFNKKRMFMMMFVRGVFTGLGGVVGATLVLALLLWILSFFQEIPLIGPLFESIPQTVNQ